MINEKKSLKQFFWLFTTGLISYFIMNTANAYLVNILGHEAYGDFSLTISLIFSLTPFFALGISSLITKYIPIYITDKSPSKLNIFMKWNTTILKKTFIILSIIILIISFIRAAHLNDNINQHLSCFISNCTYYRHYVMDLFFIIPVALLLIWTTSLLNATKNSLAAQTLGFGSLTYVCAFVIFIFEIFSQNITHRTSLIAIFISFLLLCIAQYTFVFFRIIKSKKIQPSAIKQQIVPKDTSSFYLKSGISLMFNSIIYVAMSLINMLMIEWLSPNETVLGNYVVITKISAIYMVLSASMSFLMAPYLSGLHEKNRLNDLQKLINFQILISIAWLIICITGFLVFREIIFKAYNIDFSHASFAIILSISGNFIFSLTGTSETICLYNDMNKALYPISLLQLATIGLLSYLLIPQFSYIGAIYAFFISEIICSTICWCIVRHHGLKVKILGFI